MFQRQYAEIALDNQGDARKRECDALSDVVQRLESAKAEPDDKLQLTAALDRHDAVWRVFMIDLADRANPLPDELKARIISIGLWATRRSIALRLAGGDLRSLIEVNSLVRDGLR